MKILANLRQHLLDDYNVFLLCTDIEQNKVNDSASDTRIIFDLVSGEDIAKGFANTPGIMDYTINLECHSIDVEVCNELAQAVFDSVDGFMGTMGTSKIMHANVTMIGTDYEPLQGVDVGYHMVPMEIRFLEIR